MGMVVAARLSENRGLCPAGVTDRLSAILHRLELPVTMPADLDADELLTLMGLDKKHTSTAQRFILLRDLGDAFIDTDSSAEELRTAIEACIEHRE